MFLGDISEAIDATNQRWEAMMARLGAACEKDLGFVDALIQAGLLDLATLRERASSVEPEHDLVRRRIDSHLAGYLIDRGCRGGTSGIRIP